MVEASRCGTFLSFLTLDAVFPVEQSHGCAIFFPTPTVLLTMSGDLPEQGGNGNSAGDGDITRLLIQWQAGDEDAAQMLSELIYSNLHRLAASHMRRENRQLTLQPTALVHEVMAQLLEKPPACLDRDHLYALAARMMRHFLVNQAESRMRQKRGGAAIHITLDEGQVGAQSVDVDLIALNQSLESLGELDPRKRDILEHYYFGGLTYPEIARVTSLSRATVHRELRLARAWVGARLAAGPA